MRVLRRPGPEVPSSQGPAQVAPTLSLSTPALDTCPAQVVDFPDMNQAIKVGIDQTMALSTLSMPLALAVLGLMLRNVRASGCCAPRAPACPRVPPRAPACPRVPACPSGR